MRLLVLINLVNQKGAGPMNIAQQLIKFSCHKNEYIYILNTDQFNNNKVSGKKIEYKKYDNIIFQSLYYVYFYYFHVPILIWRAGIKSYLCFGNYLHGIIPCRKRLLIHHPYLFDIRAIWKLPVGQRLLETLRYVVFRLLLIRRHELSLVVQSEYMSGHLSESFLRKYPFDIIPNPISSAFDPVVKIRSEYFPYSNRVKLRVGYICRYYPHKRHDLIPELVKRLREHNVLFELYVTIDSDRFLNLELAKFPEVVNLGEMEQAKLQHLYHSLDICIYLSDRETFGNSILEALRFGLPILGFRKEYFINFIYKKSSVLVCDDLDAMAANIARLCRNSSSFEQAVSEVQGYGARFETAREWSASMTNF